MTQQAFGDFNLADYETNMNPYSDLMNRENTAFTSMPTMPPRLEFDMTPSPANTQTALLEPLIDDTEKG